MTSSKASLRGMRNCKGIQTNTIYGPKFTSKLLQDLGLDKQSFS